jgi:hypothetical protein
LTDARITAQTCRTMRAVIGKLLPAFLAVALLGLAFLTTPLIEINQGFDADGRMYGAMAGSDQFPASFARQAPWSYRILTPYLASLLPWSTLQNFRVVAYASEALSLLLLSQILRKLGFSTGFCLLGMLFYAGDFWTLKFAAYSPAYVDHQTGTFLLSIVYLTLARQYLALVPVLALAALQKESLAVFALFPAFQLLRERQFRGDARTLSLVAALVAAPLASAVLVRVLVPVDNAYDAGSVVLHELSRWMNPRFWVGIAQATLTGLGVLPVVLLVRYREWLRFLRANPEWTLYLAISLILLFGGTDKSRLYGYALPLVIVLGLHALASLQAAAEPRRFAVWLCAVLLVHAFVGDWLTPMGSYDDYLARMVPEVAGARSIPFVIRNCVIAVGLFALTPWVLLGEWRFERASGFAASPP